MAVEYIQTVEQLLGIMPILTEYCEIPGSILAMDVESYNEDPENKQVPRPILLKSGRLSGYARTLQLGLNPLEQQNDFQDLQFVIDLMSIEARHITNLLKPLLENQQVLGHNLKYEWQFMFMQFDIYLRKMVDTMLMSQVRFAGEKMKHGLAKLYRRTFQEDWFFNKTGMTFSEYDDFKEQQQKEDWRKAILTEDNIKYAAHDVYFIHYVYYKLCDQIESWIDRYESHFEEGRGMISVCNLEHKIIPAVSLIELRGIPFDAEYYSNTVIPTLEDKKRETAQAVGLTRKVMKKRSNGLRGKKRIVWEEEVEEPINLRSWQQLKPQLNELLTKAFDKEIQIENTGEKEIKHWMFECEDKETVRTLKNILDFKKASSMLSKFGQNYVDMCTDRGYHHASILQIGSDENAVDSGRFSIKVPNWAQLPGRGVIFIEGKDKDNKPIGGIVVVSFFRRGYVSAPGWIFLDCDVVQEEPRLASLICEEQTLIEKYKQGNVDIHSIVGGALCSWLGHDPPKGTFERDYIGKTAGLALLYGIGPYSLKQFMYANTDGLVNWTDDDAKEAYKSFFKRFPGFERAMRENEMRIRQELKRSGNTLANHRKSRKPFHIVWTRLGRKRSFVVTPDLEEFKDEALSRDFEEYDEKTGKKKRNIFQMKVSAACRESFNHMIQGTAADILKLAIYKMQAAFEEAGFGWEEGIVAIIHDEVLVHVREENREKAARIVVESMKSAGQEFMGIIPCEVDLHEGRNWAEAKLSDPIELEEISRENAKV